MDTQNRAKLQEMYDEILKYYGTLPHQYQKSLNTAYPDLVNYIAARRKELDSRELVILVAGMYYRFYISYLPEQKYRNVQMYT